MKSLPTHQGKIIHIADTASGWRSSCKCGWRSMFSADHAEAWNEYLEHRTAKFMEQSKQMHQELGIDESVVMGRVEAIKAKFAKV